MGKTKGYIDILEFDCSENTVTKEILFPPQLNPMTGEWETVLPMLSAKKMKTRKIKTTPYKLLPLNVMFFLSKNIPKGKTKRNEYKECNLFSCI